MDRLDRMQLFIRVVERGSFSAAAHDLGLARSTATEAIKALEAGLGVRLLERTTRHVTTTLDGRAFYQRCLSILAEIEDAENAFRDRTPRGLLRIEAHPLLTQTFILPGLPEFLARYPGLSIHFGQGDRYVDLVREGVDLAIRAGELDDSGLIARRLGALSEITCASPAYLDAHGRPERIEDLEGHLAVGFVSSRSGEVMPLEFSTGGRTHFLRLATRVTANNSDTMAELARLGFGLVQAPRYRFDDDLATGRLVEVLPDFPPPPTPLTAVYPQNRQMTPRLRVFLDWLATVLAKADI
ncbi:LysR family transcriptional regulator [Martelella alba]|uniref:LysR family transcriptional regulator n=1 Tax=Martelella alba TaxID=2590451 RepID=A0A506UGU3_9HYPH|nr:LysR family transcriptional regulator [Martelella alba]TPW32644.1 LysR family transcriptional regulator [Martelella alba]